MPGSPSWRKRARVGRYAPRTRGGAWGNWPNAGATPRRARAALDARPAELEARRAQFLGTIESARNEHRDAVDALASAEQEAKTATGALKQAEAALGEAREGAARLEGLMAEAGQAETLAAAQITERLRVAPEEAHTIAALDPEGALPDAEAVDAKLQRLIRERENIGAVNLRAEAEASELDERIREMQESRADLLEAIARLRRGIASLNRGGAGADARSVRRD